MAIVDIRPVESGQSKIVFGICGPSGSGKTVTALLMARGMVDKPEEIGFLDTENKRGSLYADLLDGKFLIGDLYPPFSPSRFSGAIKEFQEAGVKVLVIDSVSHEWEGEGGCEDIANASLAEGKKMANWVLAKREHKGFMNVLLQSNMNIIVCIRARDKVKVEIINGKQEFVPQGMQPVCEKNFMFEMTASLMVYNEGRQQVFLKIPSYLKEIFGDGNKRLTTSTGVKIREWVEKGERIDPEHERIKSEALLICEQGEAALETLYKSLNEETQTALARHFSICKESAKAYDRQAAEAKAAGGAEVNTKPTQEDQQQQRITDFINKCTKVEELKQFDNMELSLENIDLLKKTKIKLLKHEAENV